jgi:hypothetical protein
MGVSLSWIAVRGKPASKILEQIGLERTGARCEPHESPYSFHELGNGWALLMMNRCEHEFLRAKRCRLLSQGCEVVTCTLEEHVMFSASEEWRDGARIWRACHRAENGDRDLDLDGAPPPEFEQILEWARSEQDRNDDEVRANNRSWPKKDFRILGVDYFFDVPLRLAKSRTSFEHDEEHPEIGENDFEVLVPRRESPQEKKRSRWRFW